MIKVGDIIDGKRVTKVFDLCGSLAYQSEPVQEDNSKGFPETLPELGKEKLIIKPVEEKQETESVKRGRKKKEV